MNSTEFTLSPLEEERFGVRTARANTLGRADVPGWLAACRTNGVRLAIVRCSSEDLAAAQDLEDAGARLMDTLVYYVYDYSRHVGADYATQTTIRPVRPTEVDTLMRMAAASFQGYRGHYHADRRLDPKACDEVYPAWVRRSVLDRTVADEVFVCEVDGRLDGFATMRRPSPEEGEGVLFGVAKAAQGKGIYRDLIRRGQAWCRDEGCARMVVSTQVTNLAVQKVWVRQGFEPSRSYYTFHLWLR